MAIGPETLELSPGTEYGAYRIEAPISSGAMGAVYRARDAATGELVALKRMLDKGHAARFEIEARLLKQLHHPRVVRVLDSFQEEHGTCIIMELVEGKDLHGILQERGAPGLPVPECIEYARQTCEALQYVHEQQIVHRDIKPQNLICGSKGVVVVDFGVATLLDSAESMKTVGVGTPRFMAPEVFAGGEVSARSDVFSLAATLWNLITGKAPVYADRTRLTEQFPEVSEELDETIRAGLELIPERRVASIAAFAAALGSPLTTSRGESLALSMPQPTAPRALIETVVSTAAGVFEAAAASIALLDSVTGELVFQASWGAGAKEIVGVRLPPGVGIAGAVAASGESQAIAHCRSHPHFAAQIADGTGYVPNTMVVVPLKRGKTALGVLSILDRRDGGAYGPADVTRAELFANLTIAALDVDPTAFRGLGLGARG